MLCFQIFLRTLYSVLQALSEWKSQSAHFLVRASLVSSRADAQTGFVALTVTQWLFWVSRVSLQQCCTEIGKHCWNRNPCARINPLYLHLPSATHSSSLHSHQCSLSQDFLRKHSDLLLLSSDITPKLLCLPRLSRAQKTPLSALHKFLSLWLRTWSMPSQQNQTLHFCVKWKTGILLFDPLFFV